MAIVKIKDGLLDYCLNLMFAEHVRARGLDEKTTQAYIEYYYDLVDGNYFNCEMREKGVVDVEKTVLNDMLGGTIVFHNAQELLNKYSEYRDLDEFANSDHLFFVASNGYIILSK